MAWEGKRRVKKERNLTFDVLNVLAIIGVITLHHNGLVHSYKPGPGWVQSLVFECLFYCSVPIFMMLSGANLLGYKERYDTKTFLKKRLTRVAIPWLFWAAVFLAWRLFLLKDYALEAPYWKSALDAILNSKSTSVYWFFPALIACYLAMPVLSSLRNNRRILWYIVIINFLFHSCKPAIQYFLDVKWSIDAPLGSSLLIFVVLGYLLTTKPPEKKDRRILYILGAAGVLLRFFYTWYFSAKNGMTDTSIKGYAMFHSVFYAAAAFVALCQVNWNKILPGWLKKILPDLSACSFGIFLIHRFIMHYEQQILGLGNGSWAWRLVFIPVTYAVTLGVVWVIRKIPGGKWIVGG